MRPGVAGSILFMLPPLAISIASLNLGVVVIGLLASILAAYSYYVFATLVYSRDRQSRITWAAVLAAVALALYGLLRVFTGLPAACRAVYTPSTLHVSAQPVILHFCGIAHHVVLPTEVALGEAVFLLALGLVYIARTWSQ